jgi:hypothetical protein
MAPDSPKSLWRKSAGRRASKRGASSIPAPFVVGVNRSGTTLMRMMLDAHPDLTMPPETHFVPELIDVAEAGNATPEAFLATITKQREWGDFGLTEEQLLEAFGAIEPLNAGDALREFYALYAERIGKPRCGEKTPIYVKSIRKISGALPEARFLHVIRDGRDVALSIRDRATKEHSIEAIAERWVRRIGQARRQSSKLAEGAYKEIRYEGLVLDTEAVLREVCEFFELPWDDAILDYHERSAERLEEMKRELPADGKRTTLSVERRMATHARTTQAPDPSRVSRWRESMDREQRREFESIAGELLAELGYVTGDGEGTEPRDFATDAEPAAASSGEGGA